MTNNYQIYYDNNICNGNFVDMDKRMLYFFCIFEVILVVKFTDENIFCCIAISQGDRRVRCQCLRSNFILLYRNILECKSHYRSRFPSFQRFNWDLSLIFHWSKSNLNWFIENNRANDYNLISFLSLVSVKNDERLLMSGETEG